MFDALALQHCCECKEWRPIDEGSFVCVANDPDTGKCTRYEFKCDDCALFVKKKKKKES